MQELRFVAVSEDGRYAVLAIPGRSARFTLPIDERLRAVALGQTSRLAQYEIEVESPLRPKEIQARIRAGETVEEIADAAGIAVERVRWFEGPVLAERAHMADLAQNASVRRHGDSSPGPRLGDIVAERLKAVGAAQEDAQWDARKLGDGTWLVQLAFTSGGRLHLAEWVFDPRRRHVMPADDNAARMSLPGAEPPLPAPPAPGEATVTRLAPRLSSAANHGAAHQGAANSGPASAPAPGSGLSAGHGPAAGWTRHDRPGPGRPATSAPEAPAAPEPAQPPLVASADAAGEDYPPNPAPVEKGSAPAAVQSVPAAPVASAPVAEHAGRQSRKTARSRRSSVPSWDEIMFGSTRQRD
jgi:Protein of unknown function (DUF3071)